MKRPFAFSTFVVVLTAGLLIVSPRAASLAEPPNEATTQPASAREADLFWSVADMDRTPSGQDFHGPFTNATLTASSDQMASHQWLDIRIDFFALRSLDGSVDIPTGGHRRTEGPDYFIVDLDGGPVLLYTTFSNTPNDPNFFDFSKAQNFPSFVPGERFPAQTGSSEHNTLGYHFPFNGPPQLVPMDAVYQLHFLVPHSSSDVTVKMTGSGLQDMVDENWGVRSVTVKTLDDADVPQPSDDEIAKAFDVSLKVDGDDGQAEAFNTLVRGRDATVKWLAKNVQPAPIDGGQVKTIIGDMAAGDDRIPARDASEFAMRDLGPQAEPQMRDARRSAPGELRARLDGVLQYIGIKHIDDDNLRKVMLSTRVLEVIGSPAALQLRTKLTQQ